MTQILADRFAFYDPTSFEHTGNDGCIYFLWRCMSIGAKITDASRTGT